MQANVNAKGILWNSDIICYSFIVDLILDQSDPFTLPQLGCGQAVCNRYDSGVQGDREEQGTRSERLSAGEVNVV